MTDPDQIKDIQKKAQIIVTITGVLLGLLLNAGIKYNVDNATVYCYPLPENITTLSIMGFSTNTAQLIMGLYLILSFVSFSISFCISLALVFDQAVFSEINDPTKMLLSAASYLQRGVLLSITFIVALIFQNIFIGLLFAVLFSSILKHTVLKINRDDVRVASFDKIREALGDSLFYVICGLTIIAFIINIELNSSIAIAETFILFILLILYKFFSTS